MIGVLDCNNFFVSCERVFRPDLSNKPVAVLSNNDGCFVARSNEVKALGIPMGAPAFEYQRQIKQHRIHIFSANFTLYGDISHRIMSLVKETVPTSEVYSIDEAFIDFSGVPDPIKISQQLRRKIYQYVGVPVSIGIGATKTLAKAANEWAKKKEAYNGVLQLTNYHKETCVQVDDCLSKLPVKDIWGVGRQLADFLNRYGIYTALDLKQANDKWLKQQTSINLQRTVLELRGTRCFPLVEHKELPKSILTSRTFGSPVEKMTDLKKAIAAYTTRAAEKLRKDQVYTTQVTVFVQTNRHQLGFPQYHPSITFDLPVPTNYTPTLVTYALCILKKIYRPHYQYKRAGVVFTGLISNTYRQTNLFVHISTGNKEQKLMQVVDLINEKWGSDTIMPSITGGQRHLWSTRQSQRSPNYTTDWKSLLEVR